MDNNADSVGFYETDDLETSDGPAYGGGTGG